MSTGKQLHSKRRKQENKKKKRESKDLLAAKASAIAAKTAIEAAIEALYITSQLISYLNSLTNLMFRPVLSFKHTSAQITREYSTSIVTQILKQATSITTTYLIKEREKDKKAKQKAINQKKRDTKKRYPDSCLICMEKFSSKQGFYLSDICSHTKAEFMCYECTIMNVKLYYNNIECKCPICRNHLNFSPDDFGRVHDIHPNIFQLSKNHFKQAKENHAKKVQRQYRGLY